jgi:tetratricopeptide (TPR) repeat protein
MVNKEGITMDLNQVLIEAAKDGNMLVLKTALEKGADIDATDRSGMSALMHAEQKGYKDLADFLREKGAKEEENFAIYYNKRGLAYERQEEYQKAIDEYNKAIELDPEYVNPYYNLGNAYRDLKKYLKSIDNYTKAIELDPEFAWPYNNRGQVYERHEEYQKAIDDYTRAIEISPDAKPYRNRANVYEKLEEYQKAIDDYTKAIELDPEDANSYKIRGLAYNIHGLTYNKLEEYQKAIDDYTRVIELDPEYAAVYNDRGDAYKKLHEDQKAIEDYYQAGTLYLKHHNDKEEAKECLDKIKEIDAFSQYIHTLQELIDKM